MSDNGPEIVSPDGQFRWDGQTWQPIGVLLPAQAAPATTITPGQHGVQRRSFGRGPLIAAVSTAVVVLAVVGVIVLKSAHSRSPTAAAGGAAGGQATTNSLVTTACKKWGEVGALADPSLPISIALSEAQRAAQGSSSATLIDLVANMNAASEAHLRADADTAAMAHDTATGVSGVADAQQGLTDFEAFGTAHVAVKKDCATLGTPIS